MRIPSRKIRINGFLTGALAVTIGIAPFSALAHPPDDDSDGGMTRREARAGAPNSRSPERNGFSWNTSMMRETDAAARANLDEQTYGPRQRPTARRRPAASGPDRYSSFNFEIPMDRNPRAPGGFAEVSGLELESAPIEYRNGAEDSVARRMTGIPKFTNVTLKRGIIGDTTIEDWRHAETGRIRDRSTQGARLDR